MSERNTKVPRITGVMVQYYKVCGRELWFFVHHLEQEESDYIEIGRLIHQESYSHEKKDILFNDTISVDFLKRKENIVILEIKKSSKLEEPVKYQVFYYLWYLKQKGIDAWGEIVYPKERKRERIVLTREIEEEIPQILEDLLDIIKSPCPPKPIRKSYCRKCSYFELCWC